MLSRPRLGKKKTIMAMIKLAQGRLAQLDAVKFNCENIEEVAAKCGWKVEWDGRYKKAEPKKNLRLGLQLAQTAALQLEDRITNLLVCAVRI